MGDFEKQKDGSWVPVAARKTTVSSTPPSKPPLKKRPSAPPPSNPGETLVRSIKRPPGWRASTDEPNFNQETWPSSHTAVSPKGSLYVGTIHADLSQDSPEMDYVKDVLAPQAVKVARKAVRQGKKVVFFSEGRKTDPGAAWMFSEQDVIGRALHDAFGARVELDTWDDFATDVLARTSPIWERLAQVAGGRGEAEAAMTAFMVGQGVAPDDEEHAGIITPQARKILKKKYGLDLDQIGKQEPDKDGNDPIVAQLYRMSFPGDFGDPHNSISAVGEVYNAARQDRLLARVKEVEDAGGVAIVSAGASHIYSLKPAVERG